jgi:hypothetical protein
MELTAQDKEWLKLTSSALAREVALEVIKVHVQICPHGQILARTKSILIGIGIGSGCFGGGLGFMVAKIFGA